MLFALPGMGADHRMYPAPWPSLPGFKALAWPPYQGEQTLAEVAERVCQTAGIQDGDSLIGSSLGGMVACEITRLRKIKSLFLVGSATHPRRLLQLFTVLEPLIKVAPIDWLRVSAGKVPSELSQMFVSSEPEFIRAMCRAVLHWPGLDSTEAKVYRLHGRHDLVIPPPDEVDLLLDGGHLIAMTHARECVEFIQQRS